mgnify:CR=1 FL=1
MNNVKECHDVMFKDYPDLLNITQMKEMLGIGVTLAYRLLRQKTIKARKVGREYKIPKVNVIKYMIADQ